VRQYTVRPGDSPAQIAIDHVGCPKCGIDLVGANTHKEHVVYPNGFKTFKALSAGETINLPDKWFNGDLETRPNAYFVALPYHDGVTLSGLGAAAAGILGDYATLDAATIGSTAFGSMNDRAFSQAVGEVAALLDSSVREADGSVNPGIAAYAQAVHAATNWARQKSAELVVALDGGAGPAATESRLEAQNAISTAIASARLALQAVYGGGSEPAPPAPTPPAPAPAPSSIVAVAQAAAAAIAADPNYCASVQRPGTAVNSAVHAFKAAWNSSGQAPVPINTGNYEQPTANALASVLGTAPGACGARTAAPPPATPPPRPIVVAPVRKEGLSTGAVAGIALLGAGAVGGAVYLSTRKPRRRRGGRRRRPREEEDDS